MYLKRMKTNNGCLDWNPSDHFEGIASKVLLIGHDPRLQSSDTIAEYALFADYFFKGQLKNRSDKSKFDFARKSFEQIMEITNKRYRAEEIYVTNLCNESLPHAPKGKTVLIPGTIAKEGVERIKGIIKRNSSIEIIFPMSQQVNYWFQRYGLYRTDTAFVENAQPKQKGIDNNHPYYEPMRQRAFLDICCEVYTLKTGQRIIPILHTKQYGHLLAYMHKYERLKQDFS